ncbi:unnamed protein product [Arabidopsis arenosa]|uniref:Short-chain dehydrogenase/reductase family protein n=1 Tax=Arabidopsis arenosa TaxID=38785 RepID=A0A8S2APX7_ARAAE|nr:unnamed protein product [Arabidopsis arenosa]
MEKKLPRRLEGKVAIVTASTQGIGFGIIERFGLEGASVVVSSRKQANVDEAVAKLKSKGLMHMESSVMFPMLNIAAILSKRLYRDDPSCLVKSCSYKLWEINVKSSILLLQDMAPHLEKGSSVIFITSIAGFQPQGAMAMYGVTKTALLGLTKGTCCRDGSRYTCERSCTRFCAHTLCFFHHPEAPKWDGIEEKTLLNRLGTTGDMAAAACFLSIR